MKRSWIITILFCLLLLGVGVTVILLPQTVPYSQCSEVYQRYAAVDGIDATFIRDYQVNDTLAIDATLLHATDSASWERLLNDFQTPNSFTEKPTSKAALFRFAKKGQIKPIIDTNMLNNDFFVFSQAEKRITIFHITNEDQIELCISCQLKQTLKQ